MRNVLLTSALLCVCLALPAQAQTSLAQFNKVSNPGFESAMPSYWTPSGAGAVWSTAQAHSATHSLALSGSGAASWTMDEAVRNWTDFIGLHGDGFEPGEIVVGAYVKAEGVNTNPTTDAEKFQLVFEFFDSPGGTDLLGGPVVIDLPQTAATMDWTKVTNETLGSISLPSAARSVRISFRKGANATGTMYVDDLLLSGAKWPGTIHNANVDAGGGWYYFTPDAEAGYPNGQTFVNGVTAEQSHTGGKSLKIQELKSDASEAVQISERVAVTEGKPVLVSFWVKTEGNTSPETIGTGDNNIGLTALWYNNMTGGRDGYGEKGGVDIRLNGDYNPMVIPLLPRKADNGWTQYAFVVTPPVLPSGEDPVVGMELRLRYWHAFTGTTYWDDVFVGDVEDVLGELPNLLSHGDFEGMNPSYWTPDGGGAVWSDAVARSKGFSLELTGAGAASWTMGEAVRNWTDYLGVHGGSGFTPGEIVLKGYVKAENVNTNPASDAEKFQLVFEFFDAPGGTNVLGGPVVIDLPQASATYDWAEVVSTDLGAISLPAAAKSARISFRKGASATGTMYFDDLTISASGGWPGTIHNSNFDAGGGWYYYTPDAEGGFPSGQTFVNSASKLAAYEGDYGARITRVGTAAGEAVHISERMPVTAGEPVLVSFWMRTAGNLDPDSIGVQDPYNVGFTGLWYTNLTAGDDGYGEVGGFDVRFNGQYNDRVIPKLPKMADTPWQHYAFVANPPVREAGQDPVVGMELRLRYWEKFTGEAHFDNVFVTPLGGDALVTTSVEFAERPSGFSATGLLLGNAPNPFSRLTTLALNLPQAQEVTLEVFDVLGRKVATLVDGTLPGGLQHVGFDASDLPTGTYVYVLRAGSTTESRLMTLVR